MPEEESLPVEDDADADCWSPELPVEPGLDGKLLEELELDELEELELEDGEGKLGDEELWLEDAEGILGEDDEELELEGDDGELLDELDCELEDELDDELEDDGMLCDCELWDWELLDSHPASTSAKPPITNTF